jgi:uncharacterized BrkB/YihY/UPF0761 family membrane protein
VTATVRGFRAHNVFTTSAALAFYLLLSLLPFFDFSGQRADAAPGLTVVRG